MSRDFSKDPEVLRCMYEASLAESGTRDTGYALDRTSCELCNYAHETEQDAEACERRHGLEHDAHCPCETCRMERAADTAREER